MAIVDFKQVRQVEPSKASPINGSVSRAMGPLDGSLAPRQTLYDATWGYFLFGQQVTCVYGENDAYVDIAEFTIRGQFTPAAEHASGRLSDPSSDQACLLAMTARLEALEQMFDAASLATAPESLADYGTESDPRVIRLPEPLRDKDGNPVYGIPTSISVEPSTFPNGLAYRAVLREAKFPDTKLVVNDSMLDAGTISINLPSPILAKTEMVWANGAALMLKNYSVPEVTCQGLLPHLPSSGRSLTDREIRLIEGLYGGVMDVKLHRLDPVTRQLKEDVIFAGVATQEPEMNINVKEQVMEFTVRGMGRS